MASDTDVAVTISCSGLTTRCPIKSAAFFSTITRVSWSVFVFFIPSETGMNKVKYTWICIARLRTNASNALTYGSHSVTCKQHRTIQRRYRIFHYLNSQTGTFMGHSVCNGAGMMILWVNGTARVCSWGVVYLEPPNFIRSKFHFLVRQHFVCYFGLHLHV